MIKLRIIEISQLRTTFVNCDANATSLKRIRPQRTSQHMIRLTIRRRRNLCELHSRDGHVGKVGNCKYVTSVVRGAVVRAWCVHLSHIQRQSSSTCRTDATVLSSSSISSCSCHSDSVSADLLAYSTCFLFRSSTDWYGLIQRLGATWPDPQNN